MATANNTATFIDTHAHYDDKRYNEDREELFALMAQNGVSKVINASSSYNASKRGIALAETYPFLFAAIGVHPHYTDDLTEEMFEHIAEMAKHKRVVAVGETGLDYYYEHSRKETQRYWFARHLALAADAGLPVIVHCRDAAQEVFDTIADKGAHLRGVIHCYSGSVPMARDYADLGYYIGVGGIITFKNAKKAVEVVRELELSRILLETDCPYLSPEPNRGARNDSINIKYIAKTIAEIKGVSYEEVCEVTSASACDLFKGITDAGE